MRLIIKSIEDGQESLGLFYKEEDKVYTFKVPAFYINEDNVEIYKLKSETKIKLKKLLISWAIFSKKFESLKTDKKYTEENYFNINIVLDLIKDFTTFGLYSETEKIVKISNYGKIDFKKTIQKTNPKIINNSVFFSPYCSNFKKKSEESLLRKIQISVLNEISTQFGWLLGFSFNYNEINPIKSDIINLLLLEKLKFTTYNSRKLFLIESLSSYLKSRKSETHFRDGFFISKAWLFWEIMVKDVFGNVTDSEIQRSYNVKHAYKEILSNKITHHLVPLRPDAVFISETKIRIIDAKYYLGESLPDNSSISKQFIYLFKTNLIHKNIKDIKSIFILPTNKQNHFEDFVAIFDADISNLTANNMIDIYKVNVEFLIESFINNRKLPI
jgi:hypothetical protein